MNAGHETRSRRLTGFVVALAVIVAAWILLRTWHGPSINEGDGWAYLSSAENIAEGNGHRRFSGYWLSVFPPVYPLVLAGFELLGISARDGSRWLNAVLYGGTVLFAGWWLKAVCRSAWPVAAAVLAMASVPIWHDLASSYWAEPLHLGLTVVSLTLLSRFLQTPPSLGGSRALWLLLAAAGLAGAAVATRYIGVAVIAAGCLTVLFFGRENRPATQRIVLTGVYGLAASLPVIPVLILNQAKAGNLMGRRSDVPYDSHNSFREAIDELVSPQTGDFVVAWLILGTALVLGVAVGSEPGYSKHGYRWLRPRRTVGFAVFAVVHIVILVSADQLLEIEVSDRYVLPAWLALVFVGAELLDGSLSRLPSREQFTPLLTGLVSLAGIVIIAAVANLAILNADRTADALRFGKPFGDFSEEFDDLSDSALVDYLRDHPSEEIVYSNWPAAVWWVTGHKPVRPVARGQGPECTEWFSDVEPGRIVWFSISWPRKDETYCDIPALQASLPHLQVLHGDDMGTVYGADFSEQAPGP